MLCHFIPYDLKPYQAVLSNYFNRQPKRQYIRRSSPLRMLSKCSFLFLLCPALLQGFTLDNTLDGSKKLLKPPDLSAYSLLGWSMAHYNQDIILGAPLESGTGIYLILTLMRVSVFV